MKLFLCAAAAALLLSAPGVYAQTAPTGSFNYSTKIDGDGTLTATLSWETTPAATSCTALGDDEWEGPKAASGTQTLAPFPNTTPKTWALSCSWPGMTSVLLTWTPPSLYTDGTPITNLAGHHVHYGKSATALTGVVDVKGPTVNTYTLDDLDDGLWYFGVRAYTTEGIRSDLSNIVSHTLTGPVEWSHTVGVKKPAAPVMAQ